MSEEDTAFDALENAKLELKYVLDNLVKDDKTVSERENGSWQRWREKEIRENPGSFMEMMPPDGHYLEYKPAWTVLSRLNREKIHTFAQLKEVQVLPENVTRNLTEESNDFLVALQHVAEVWNSNVSETSNS